MNSGLIRQQHLLLRLAIFGLGISTSIEISQRQLAAQFALFFLYMLAEPSLYKKFFIALRKLLSWFAAYWLFSLFFAISFEESLLFTIKIIYLVLIMVAAWGSVEKQRLLSEIHTYLKHKPCKSLLFYILSTVYFAKMYFRIYSLQTRETKIAGILDKAILSGKQVFEQSAQIESKVSHLLNEAPQAFAAYYPANLYGLAFLSLLGIVFSL
jgi:hypothetical protein